MHALLLHVPLRIGLSYSVSTCPHSGEGAGVKVVVLLGVVVKLGEKDSVLEQHVFHDLRLGLLETSQGPDLVKRTEDAVAE